MREKNKGGEKKPQYAQRCMTALRKGLKTPIQATGRFWKGVLTEKVKGIIAEAIPNHRSWDSTKKAEVLEFHAAFIVERVAQPIVVDGKDGGKIEI